MIHRASFNDAVNVVPIRLSGFQLFEEKETGSFTMGKTVSLIRERFASSFFTQRARFVKTDIHIRKNNRIDSSRQSHVARSFFN
ncbi:Uncharacterised protein [Mycobacteroides abscessus subsp. massiliense]|nr:Uncharacterised protein [Mycobacteroides abscessus subsp. massiliense]